MIHFDNIGAGFGATEAIYHDSAAVSDVPMTVACWHTEEDDSPTTDGGAMPIAGAGDASEVRRATIDTAISAGGAMQHRSVLQSPTTVDLTGNVSASYDTLYHLATTFSTSLVELFKDGTSVGSDASVTYATNSGYDRVGVNRHVWNGNARWPRGDTGGFSIWNVVLTDAEIASLAVGADPRRIRPTALVEDHNLFTYADRLAPRRGAQLSSVNGTPVDGSAHPKIIRSVM